jgi:cytoskeletal protein RodZ
MNKKRHETNEKTGSPSTVVIMGVAIVALLGLLVWALTRTVEPSPTSAPVATALPSSTTTPITPATPAATDTTPGATPAAATPTATSADIHPETGVERISVEDFRTKFNAGNVVIIDVRDSSSYAAGHIPGAMNIPFASVQGFTDMIPKGKEIVTYCT